MSNEIKFGDCREIMGWWIFQDVKVQTCVTSPPYFGLRDYGVEGQLGLEETPDQYVKNMVEVFRLVRDLLTDDGTLWLNLGDSYANDSKWGGSSGGKHAKGLHGKTGIGRGKKHTGLKSKDLIGIPWRVAFALQADGWYLRQDIIWHKPNPMPESVRDRCTKAHEYIFMLSKSPRYYYDSIAIRTPAKDVSVARQGRADLREKEGWTEAYHGNPPKGLKRGHYVGFNGGRDQISRKEQEGLNANKRSVWTVSTKPYKGAHFATFPADLIEPCILAGSRVGDVVLDPFMGSGTTAQVALKHGRQYLGCELNPEYKTLIDKRLETK